MQSSLDVAEQIRPRKVAALCNGEMGFSNELDTFHGLSLAVTVALRLFCRLDRMALHK